MKTLQQAVEDLPTTKEGLITKMREMGVKALPAFVVVNGVKEWVGRCGTCPIAHLLQIETGHADVRTNAIEAYRELLGEPVQLPDIVRDFIVEIDKGQWPEFDYVPS